MEKGTAVAIFLTLVFGLENCSGAFSSPVATDTPKAPSQTSSISLANPTNSPTKPVQTASPTLMNTAVPNMLSPTLAAIVGSANGLTKNCVNILQALPQASDYQGRLILNNLDTNINYLYDFQTAQTKNLSIPSEFYIAVSPDGKKYAYHDKNSPYLRIFSSDGRLQRSIPWEKDWLGVSGWLDDNRLLFAIPKYTTNSIGMWNIEYPEPLLLLNLTTNQRQNLLPDYPGIDKASNSISWWSGTTVYDASLSRVIYPGELEEAGSFNGYILWDIPDKKKLAELPSPTLGKEPIWSPDGSKFIVNGDGGEFYLVTRDGGVSKITDLNPDYAPLSNNIHNLDSTAYSWSPDSRSVAFWLDSSEPANSTLAVLDTQTGKTVNYCIQAEYGLASDNNPPESPVWSPDGKAIVVGASTIVGQPKGDVVLVDIEKGLAAKVTAGLAPIGWLAAP